MWSGGRFRSDKIEDRDAIQITTLEIAEGKEAASYKVGEMKNLVRNNIAFN